MTDSAERLRRLFVVAVSAAAAIWLAYASVTHEWAYHDGASDNPDAWQKAAEIEPANADNWYRLGRYRHLDFNHEDLPKAVSYYERAIRLDPLSPYYKLDLAGALELENRNTEADRYYREAQQEYPLSGEVSWRYGNFLLRQQRLRDAYAQLYRSISVEPRRIPAAVSLVWRATQDVDALVGQVLRNRPDWDWQALDVFVQSNNGPAALKTWSYLAAQKSPPEFGEVNPLVDLLVQQGFYDEAGLVWRQALEISGILATSSGSLVFDGDFERDLSGGGFGWRSKDVAGASFDFDSNEKHSGTRSARVTFDGTQNLGYADLYQQVLVRPNTRYHFSAFLRTDQITTDSGVSFELRDLARPPAFDVVTPNEIGTKPWTAVQADFTTGSQTRVLQLLLRRAPSQRFDNKIQGTVWIDDVALLPAGSGE